MSNINSSSLPCPSCRTPNQMNARFCTNCGAPLNAPQQETPYQAPATHQAPNFAAGFVYAGFWKRLFAYWVDGIIFAFFAWIFIFFFFASSFNPNTDPMNAFSQLALIYVGYFVAWWLYFALQESSSAQATLGKRLLGIKVTDMQGQGLSFGHAAGRQLAGVVTQMTFTIGYLMAAFTGRKQALHDMIAGCVVVNRNFDSSQIQATNVSPPPGMSIGAIIGVVAIVLIIPVGGIIAAISIPAYQDYTVRATVNEGYAHAKEATPSIVAYSEENGYWPQNFEQAGLSTEDFQTDKYYIQLLPTGELLVSFQRPQQISNGSLKLVPEFNTDATYSWKCVTADLEVVHVPSDCRN